MSMLDRYRKPGGFYQLVSLVETCGTQKQIKFLEIIHAEDPKWSEMLRSKMLDINRIYSWNDETIREIVGTLQDLTLAIVLHGATKETKERLLKILTVSRRRKIEDLFQSTNPTPLEVTSMQYKIIETVRKMSHDGFLRFDKFDPDLFMSSDIEDFLNKPSVASLPHTSHVDEPKGSHQAVSGNSMFKIEYNQEEEVSSESGAGKQDAAISSPAPVIGSPMELAALNKKLSELSKENAVLRHELSVARTKLEQIKKIA